ncbi:MAG: CRISPR-associated protein Cas5 [Candidatus Sigynarchaeota archaeon]
MKALQVCARGFTASFRIPFAIAGVQVTCPVPTYGTLLGFISCCAGRLITPKDTRIGFEFTSSCKAQDLERIIRWDYNPKTPGMAKLNDKGPGIRQREFLVEPQITLFVSNLSLKESFLHPRGIPVLGRSQDLVRIDSVEEIELIPVKKGSVGGTLLPFRVFKDKDIPGLVFKVPEYMEYDSSIRLREPRKNEMFIATSTDGRSRTEIQHDTNLFKYPNSMDPTACIYLHDWLD